MWTKLFCMTQIGRFVFGVLLRKCCLLWTRLFVDISDILPMRRLHARGGGSLFETMQRLPCHETLPPIHRASFLVLTKSCNWYGWFWDIKFGFSAHKGGISSLFFRAVQQDYRWKLRLDQTSRKCRQFGILPQHQYHHYLTSSGRKQGILFKGF